VRYQPAARNPTATGCQTGTRALGLAVRDVWPELQTLAGPYGCFNRRKIAGGAVYSLHAEGRALDIGVGPGEDDHGWTLACDLVAHRVTYGIQRVIWSGHMWSVERINEWRTLAPRTDQHLDHIHAEQHWAGARRPSTVQPQLEAQLRKAR
jgi:hypothetical protein